MVRNFSRRRLASGQPIDCAGIARHISAFLDGELDHATAAAIVAHLDLCRDCPPEAAAVAALRSALRELGTPPSSSMQRLRAWIETATGAAPAGGPEPG